MKLEGASFSWDPESPLVLEDIDVQLMDGKLHMVVGPVASVSLELGGEI